MNVTKASKSFLATINNYSIAIDHTKLITIFCTSLLCALFYIAAAAPVQAESTMEMLMKVIGNEREEIEPSKLKITKVEVSPTTEEKPVPVSEPTLTPVKVEVQIVETPAAPTRDLQESANPSASNSSEAKTQSSNGSSFDKLLPIMMQLLTGMLSPGHAGSALKCEPSADKGGNSGQIGGGGGTPNNSFINGLQNCKRGTPGALNFTSYSSSGDTTPDKHSSQKRGAWNNLLRPGSVALSPEIVRQYRPARGSSVYVNGNLIGYYEDHTPSSYKGVSYGKTIDVYQSKYNPFFKCMPSGSYEITFGPPRAQVSNPS